MSLFTISNAEKHGSVSENINEELLKKATQIVLAEMTEVEGDALEVDKHNKMLLRCSIGDREAQQKVKHMIKNIIEIKHKLASPPLSDKLINQIYIDNYGLGAIDDLITDTGINEIWVNGKDHVWIEEKGFKKRLKDRKFKSDQDVLRIIRQILQFDGKEVTHQEPIKESRTLDGARITVIIPPAGKVPYINIRKFDSFHVSRENLIKSRTLNDEMADWIENAVKGRANILVIGETGSGKTSLLKWIIGNMNEGLRLGTLETSFELKVDELYPEKNVFAYECHEELGIGMSDLFKVCLRSSPDIIICGEARGAEADELIRCMRRGHPGSVGTIHTNSPQTAIPDLGEMINEDGKRRDPVQLQYRIASAIDVIVQIRRFEETGERKVVKISEVRPNMNGETFEVADIFRYELVGSFEEGYKFNKVDSLTLEKKLKFMDYGLDNALAERM